MRLEHTNITVKDIDQSIAFYSDIFGFEVRWRGEANGVNGPVRAVHVGTNDTYISLFEAVKAGEIDNDYGVPGVNHIGFEVGSLAEYRARLAERGIGIHLEQDYEPGKRIYFRDPDGIEIELVSYSD